MLIIEKLATFCFLSSSLILLVSADPNLNPCDNSDWESKDSDYLKDECEAFVVGKLDIFYGCLEKLDDKYMVRCTTTDDDIFYFRWTGQDPIYIDEPPVIMGVQ